MNLPALVSRVLAGFRAKAAEGEYRPGPWLTMDGWLPHAWGKYANFWQLGYNPLPAGTSAMVEACVSAYAQSVAMCPCNHWRELPGGGREKVRTSAASRILRQPNDYQTIADFFLNLTRSLYLDGNAYALALRNDRFEVASLHLMHPRQCFPQIVEGEIYYALGGNKVIEGRLAALDENPLQAVPARDVLHVRLHTPRDVLKGDTPLTAAALAVTASNTALAQTITFFENQARPSGVLETDLTLTKPQVDELRQRWDEQAAGLNRGGTPILTSGLKWSSVAMSAQDAQLADAMKLSDAQIAEVFRVPLPIIGGANVQPTGSTEALMNFWIANGLGFALNQVELALDKLFALTPNEYTELDTTILLRSAFRERMEGLRAATIGGIFSPDEARAFEGLPPSPGGHGKEPRVQQQVVPLSYWEIMAESARAQARRVEEPPEPDNDDEPDDDEAEDDEVEPEPDKAAAAPTRDEWRRWLNGQPA